jgi:hypothetical protein
MSLEEEGNDLRGILTQEVEKSEVAPSETPPATVEPKAPDVSPISDGALEPTSSDSSTPSEATDSKPVESPHPTEETKEEAAEKQRLDRPPQAWKAEAKKHWNELPLAARQEVQRREADTQFVLRENASAKQFVGQVEQIVTPHLGWMQAAGVQPLEAINNLLHVETIARSGTAEQKVDLAVQYLIDYGVDLNKLDSALSKRLSQPQQAPVNNNQNTELLRMIQQELAPVRSFMSSQQQAETNALQNEIETFGNNHEYLEDLREDMAVILEVAANQKRAMGLDQAYNIALAGRPDIAQAASLRSKQTTSANLRNAASSIAGSSGQPVAIQPNNPQDLRAQLLASFGE